MFIGTVIVSVVPADFPDVAVFVSAYPWNVHLLLVVGVGIVISRLVLLLYIFCVSVTSASPPFLSYVIVTVFS